MDQTILHQYTDTYGVRFTKRQKKRFREALIADFQELGYEHLMISGRKRLTKTENMIFGSVKQAKTIVAISYDTPQRVFGSKTRFYPLDGSASLNHSLLPTLLPALLFYLIMLVLVNVASTWLHDAFYASLALLLFILGFAILLYYMIHGFANRRNACRYSASIAAALEIAKSLNKDQRKACAFVFLDGFKTRCYGAQLVAEHLQKQNRNPNVILLSCVERGSSLVLGYQAQAKKTAHEINKSCKEKRLQTVALRKEMCYATPIEFFNKSMILAAGEWDEKKRLFVTNTANHSDTTVDETNLDAVIQTLSAYLRSCS